MTAQIGLVCHRGNDHQWLPRLREWIDKSPLPSRLGAEAPEISPWRSPDEALQWRAEHPCERVVVTFGYSRGEIEGSRKLVASAGEPIIVREEAVGAGTNASATFINGETIVACHDVKPQIRKSLIRVALRKRVEIRQPRSDKELADYFSLRYQVWKAVGYLRDDNKQTTTDWEIDFWDRTATPICAITRDGQVIGCARLIRSYGNEEHSYVARIQSLLDNLNDPILRKLFNFPHSLRQPFDLLEEFPEFRPHFQSLIKSRTNMAEIGRVAVDAEHRGQCLSEALVDTALSFAKQRGVSRVFLACREKHNGLYARSGFEPVKGLSSDRFFNIPHPSIVMEKRI